MSFHQEAQADTLEKFVEAWKVKDTDATIALWSPDFTQRLLPSSLGLGKHSRSEAAIIYPGLMRSLSNWSLEINETVHDAGKRTAAIYASSSADTPFPEDKWEMEYAVFLSFSEDGRYIDSMSEMLDTSVFHNIFPKLRGYIMEQAKKEHAQL